MYRLRIPLRFNGMKEWTELANVPICIQFIIWNHRIIGGRDSIRYDFVHFVHEAVRKDKPLSVSLPIAFHSS